MKQSLICLSFFTIFYIDGKSRQSLRCHHHQHQEKPQPNPDRDILIANTVNALIQGFVAANSQDDKQARIQAVTSALTSIANMFHLAFRSLPTQPLDDKEAMDLLAVLIYKYLTDPTFMNEVDACLIKKSKSLKDLS